MKNKENNNPFNMIGSYIGAIVWVLINVSASTLKRGGFGYFNVWTITGNQIFASLIFGFLTGWGIHSLIRKLKK